MFRLNNRQLVELNERARMAYNLSYDELIFRNIERNIEAGTEAAIMALLMADKIIDGVK